MVALFTYFITLNLNNLVRLLRRLYAPRRHALLDQMELDTNWNSLGLRFKAFQRHEGGEQEPSEWMIIAFSLRQMAFAILKIMKGLFLFRALGHKPTQTGIMD